MQKCVVVTGSSQGLGKAIIKKYAREHYRVVITYLHHKKEAYNLAEEVKSQFGVETLVVKVDVSKEEDIENLYQQTQTLFGRVDVLVNNAGVAKDTSFEEKTKENFLKILDTNVVGAFLVSKYFGSKMLEAKNGVIINIASNNAFDMYYPESLDYDASKAALLSLTHNLATVFAPYVRVNAIAPGWMNTSMGAQLDDTWRQKEMEKILLGRFAEAEEVAELVYFLGSDKASYINDSVIRIDGGIKRC